MKKLIAVVLMLSGMCFSQAISSTARRVAGSSALPLTCNIGPPADVWMVVSGGVAIPYYCASANTWSAYGSVGSAAFGSVTSGTNTGAAMVCGTGCSIATSGSGTNDATTLQTHAASYFQIALGYTPLNPANNGSDFANVATTLSNLSGQGKLGATPTTVSMGGANGTKALVYVNTNAPKNLYKPYFDGTDWQTAASAITPNSQTAASTYAIKGMEQSSPDLGKLVICASSCTGLTVAQAGTCTTPACDGSTTAKTIQEPAGFFFWVKNTTTSSKTLTATTSTFDNGLTTLAIAPLVTCLIESDGTNYHESCPTVIVAAGTAAMGTSAISSGACATAVQDGTVSSGAVANVLTTDRIQYMPNGDPTAVTGYAVSATGSVYIWAYPTAGHVNFKVCNNTSGSLTPGALTLNWAVLR